MRDLVILVALSQEDADWAIQTVPGVEGPAVFLTDGSRSFPVKGRMLNYADRIVFVRGWSVGQGAVPVGDVLLSICPGGPAFLRAISRTVAPEQFVFRKVELKGARRYLGFGSTGFEVAPAVQECPQCFCLVATGRENDHMKEAHRV